MAEITSLTSVLKGNINLNDYFVVANSTTKKARRMQAKSLFPSLATKGTGGESLYSGITNSNQLNFKGIKSGDTGLLTVATTDDNLVLTVLEAGIDLSLCDNTTSKFLTSVDLSVATNTLGANRGGTGLTSVPKGSVLYANGADSITTTTLASDGQLLIGNGTTGYPQAGTLSSSDSSITITNTAGGINIQTAATSTLASTLDCSTYNINLNDSSGNSFLSGDGTSEGVHVDSSGYVFIGDNTTTVPSLDSALTIGGNATTAISIGNTNNYKAQKLKFTDAAGTNAGLAGTIEGAAGSGSNQAGGALTVIAGKSTGTGTGGALNLDGGDKADAGGTGGAINLRTYPSAGVSRTAATIAVAGTSTFNYSMTLGSSADLIMGSGAIKPGSGGMYRPTPVVLDDDSVTLTAATNGGRTNVIPDVSSNRTYTLTDAAAGGEYYHFIYGGAAADAQNVIIKTATTADSVYFKGAVTHLDQTADENCEAAFSDGNSNDILTITTPRVIDLHFLALDANVWYVWGHVCSATAPTFSDS